MIPVLLLLSFAPATCRYDDHRCQAERYVALADEAREAGDHANRVQRLYLAHREYLYLFDETRKPEALCRARRVLTDALALKPTPPHLVDRFRSSAQDTSTREHDAGVDCKPRKKASTERRLAAKARVEDESASEASSTPPTGGSEPTPATVASAGIGAQREDAETPALPAVAAEETTTIAATTEPDGAESAAPAQGPLAREPSAGGLPAPVHGPQPAPGVPSPTRIQVDRKSAARIGGGVVLLLTGGGLAGGMVGALVKRRELTQTFQALEAQIEAEKRDGTAGEYARAGQLNSEYRVLTIVAGVTGTAAALGFVGGGLLLREKSRQILALPWSSPHTAGLTLRGRF